MKLLQLRYRARLCALLLVGIGLFVSSCRDEQAEPKPNIEVQDIKAVLKEDVNLRLDMAVPVDAGEWERPAEARSITLLGEPARKNGYTPRMDWSTCEWGTPEGKPVVLLAISNKHDHILKGLAEPTGGAYEFFRLLKEQDYEVILNTDPTKAPTLRIYGDVTLRKGTVLSDYRVSAMILDRSYRSSLNDFDKTGSFRLKQAVEYLSSAYDLDRELHQKIFRNLIFGLTPTPLAKYVDKATSFEDKLDVRFKPLNVALVVELVDSDKNSNINKAVIGSEGFTTEATISMAMSWPDDYIQEYLDYVKEYPGVPLPPVRAPFALGHDRERFHNEIHTPVYRMSESVPLNLTVENLFEGVTRASERYHRVLVLALPNKEKLPDRAPSWDYPTYSFRVNYYDRTGQEVAEKSWQFDQVVNPFLLAGRSTFVNTAPSAWKFGLNQGIFLTEWTSGPDGRISFYIHPKYIDLGGRKTPLSYLPYAWYSSNLDLPLYYTISVDKTMAGWQQIEITGLSPNKTYYVALANLSGFQTAISDNETTTPEQLIRVLQWGTSNEWGRVLQQSGATQSYLSFMKTKNLEEITASDIPNFESLRSLGYMFSRSGVHRINRIEDWDVSAVENMNRVFAEAKNFNGDLSRWNVSNVVRMNSMFYLASQFNSDISGWDVTKVKDNQGMFVWAESFKQNLGKWRLISWESPVGAFSGPIFGRNTAMSDDDFEATFAGWKAFAEANPNVLRNHRWAVPISGDQRVRFENPNLPSLRWFRDNRGWSQLDVKSAL